MTWRRAAKAPSASGSPMAATASVTGASCEEWSPCIAPFPPIPLRSLRLLLYIISECLLCYQAFDAISHHCKYKPKMISTSGTELICGHAKRSHPTLASGSSCPVVCAGIPDQQAADLQISGALFLAALWVQASRSCSACKRSKGEFL